MLKRFIPWNKGKQGIFSAQALQRISEANIKKIDLRPDRELGYFSGLVIGDGWIYRQKSRNYIIAIESTKIDIIDQFSKSAIKLSLKPSRIYIRQKTRKFPNGEIRTDTLYKVLVNSKILYDVLKPYKQNEFRWQIPKFLNTKESLFGFIGGLFDAEGNVGLFKIAMASKHTENLIQIKKLLQERLGFTKGNITVTENKCSSLHIYGRENLKQFEKAEVRIKKEKLQKLLRKPIRGYTEREYEEVIRLQKIGLGSVRISKMVKIPISTVEDWIYKGQKPWKQFNKIPYYKREKKPQKSIEPLIFRVLELREKGFSSRKIGRLLGFNKTTILRVLKKTNKGCKEE